MKRFLERGGGWIAGQVFLFEFLLVLAVLYPGTGPAALRYAGAFTLVVAVAGASALG